ncbi:MAG: ribonuclease HIII [Melioribacteraceae bacterium]|nr:ribonuclease HIII [Melioribacteraceae bacterium]
MDTKQKAESTIENYRRIVDSDNIKTSAIEEKQFNFEFTAGNIKERIKVQVYFGKKGLRTVLQGNKENSLYKTVQNLIIDQKSLMFDEKPPDEPSDYIGSDESGKGDLFGPLVVCAFHCLDEYKNNLIRIGVRDSKDLSPSQISELAKMIKRKFSNDIETVLITPEKYNIMYERFRNLNKILSWAHSKAIENLLKRVKCSNVVIDKFSEKENFESISNSAEIYLTHKAERFTGVAAASIIARSEFDNWFIKNNLMHLPKGASTETVKIAEKIFDTNGIDELEKYAKIHFKSLKHLIK